MILVRDLVSNTRHSVYGRLEYGHIHEIKEEHFNTVLFEIIPRGPEDIFVPEKDITGQEISKSRRERIKKETYERYVKNVSQAYDKEHKLAKKRLTGGK